MLPLPPPLEPSASKVDAIGEPTAADESEEPLDEPAPEPLPDAWLSWLKANVFHYRLLNEKEQARLHVDLRRMVTKKDWEGCRGLSVTDEMKVTIAGQACLMLLGREHDCFGSVRTILVYPTAFQANDEEWQDQGWTPMELSGRAVYHGPVILAWNAVLKEGRDPSSGYNLVIHEFAHQLDLIDGYADATLDLQGDEAERWQTVLTADYNQLRREVRHGHKTFLGEYAASSKTEFFATSSERFFTLPVKLRHYHPQLYDMLAAAYALNPEKWFAASAHETKRENSQ